MKKSLLNTTTAAPVKVLYGDRIARRRLTPDFRALIADDLRSGRAALARLTKQQACAVTGANLAYASKAARLTPLERAEVERRQLKLFHVKHQRTPTDAAVDRAVKRLGLDRVLQSLDRLTRPVAEAAE